MGDKHTYIYTIKHFREEKRMISQQQKLLVVVHLHSHTNCILYIFMLNIHFVLLCVLRGREVQKQQQKRERKKI